MPSENSMNPFNQLQYRAEVQPSSLFLYTEERSMTNLEAFDTVRKIVSYFRMLGIKSGDLIALNMPSPVHILFMLATWHEAAISVAYSPHILNQNMKWKPDWLFSLENYPSDAAQRVVKLDSSVFENIEGMDFANSPRRYNSKSDYLRILFSSGTTGTPKGVPFSLEVLEKRALVRNKLWLDYGPFLSLFDIGSLGGFGTFHGQLLSGATYIPPATPSVNARNILKHKIEHIQGSPNQISALVDIAERHEYRLSTLKLISVAGSAITPYLNSRIQKVLKSRVQNLYASTEGGVISYRVDDSQEPDDLGNVLPSVLVQVVDDTDVPLAFGEKGRIRVKSNESVKEYFKDSEATNKFFRDGWFYPGDLGRLMENGRLYLEGRDDELVNIGGLKVDPMKVDSFVVGQLDIVDAGAFGFQDSNGESSFAVAIVSQVIPDFEAILELLRSHFGHGSPRFVYQVNEIPRNERGKVDRRRLAIDLQHFWSDQKS